MTKLEQLKQQVADMFNKAEEKEVIDQLAAINTTIDEVTKEQELIEGKNAELLKSYKDLVQHTSVGTDKAPDTTDITGAVAPSFDEVLSTFMQNQK